MSTRARSWAPLPPQTGSDPEIIYTDGSRTDTGTGAGIYFESWRFGFSLPLSDDNTVFQAEMAAINSAAAVLEEKEIKNTTVIIHTDSRSSLVALSNKEIKSRLVLNMALKLNRLSTRKGLSISLRWVKGHSCVLGNEVADLYAKEGAESQGTNPRQVKTFYTTIKQSIKKAIKLKWDSEWLGARAYRCAIFNVARQCFLP